MGQVRTATCSPNSLISGHPTKIGEAEAEPESAVEQAARFNLDVTRRKTMSTSNTVSAIGDPQLAGQTVVVIGGSSGIGLETARLARAEGANVVITGRNPERLKQAATEVGALSSAAFDAADFDRLDRFFDELPAPFDHVMITAGSPYYARLADIDFEQARRHLDHLLLAIQVARKAAPKMRPGGTLLLTSGTGGRRPALGGALSSAMTAALPALGKVLALEIAPVRVNVIAPGFVDTPLSATLLGEGLDERRDQLRKTLPIHRVIGPADVAALAVHLMTNTALTGATYDVDGGQQLLGD
jgi:NAD(P)-dependent dehydrogenase (short-subunit alcohol dehydrogenase family)